MNIYEAMRRVLEYAIGYLDIVPNAAYDNPDIIAIDRMIAEYDALVPDWDSAPEWAQWYAIDANDEAAWYAKEPAYDSDGWHVIGVTNISYCEAASLPLGIDWRLCKWQRPEVTK